MHNRMRFVPLVVIVVVAMLGVYWWTTRVSVAEGALTASGTIEATEVTVSPELAGRVVEALAAEGNRVSAGQVLIRLDDSLLQAQLKQTEAALAAAQAQHDAAQANYDLLKSGAQADQIRAAEEAVKAAEAAVSGAQAQLAQLKAGARSADIAAAEAAVAAAAAQQKVALDTHDKTMQCVTVPKPAGPEEMCPGLGTREEQARAALNAADEALAAAQKRLDQLKAGATKNELDAAQSRVEAAQAQHAMAQAQLDLLKAGARPEQLAAAEAQIKATQAQIDAAQAQIGVLKVQIDKLTLRAPLDGLVLQRAIEPGEVALPGAALLVLGNVTDLRVTVYIPENRYGEIGLGQAAKVTVDSFPGETFSAKVTRIADKAEFTPRNVQTAEGRATTVFAVTLALDSAGGKLKPGMPVDVRFDE